MSFIRVRSQFPLPSNCARPKPNSDHDPVIITRALAISLATTAVFASALLLARPHKVHGAADAPSTLSIDYPLAGSVIPPDMDPPTFLFRDPASRATTWSIDIAFTDSSPAVHITTGAPLMQVGEIDKRCIGPTNKLPELTPEEAASHTWKPDAATWSAVRAHAIEHPATITISGYAANDPTPISRGTTSIVISRDPVGAPIFFRDVPLMPSATEKGFIKPLANAAIPLINWSMRNVAEPKSRVVMTDLHSCANCHSFSRDGKTLGLDMDGPQNDKGLYALVPIAQKMIVRTQDMISWASFRGELDPQLRVGFMSQVSPDGRYVVTTVKPPHTRSSQFYYVANFTDYRFLQVFYPTRGILAIYDRTTKQLHPLPGADDPSFVQASAVWSPDGKYLVFARAVATDPVPADGVMAKYANDPKEVQIQYDLYRIPFNDGRGGTPEPIKGASANGMSNSFAKISPDGKWLVFVQAKNGQLMRPDGKLYIVPAAGGTPRLMTCNTALMNSWHSWSPNGRWLVFSSKSRGPYTKMFLTHIDENGNDTPPILIENATAANRAVNIPEFVNMDPSGIYHIDTPAVDFYKQYDVAADLAKKGQYAAAIPEWRKALAMQPDDPRAHNGFGETLAKSGHRDEAVTQFHAALNEKPQFAEAHNNLGILLAASGKPGDAIGEFNAALEVNPGYADTHNNLGRLFLEQHKVPEAIEQFQHAIESNPGFAEAHNNLGSAYAAKGHADDAIAEYRLAIEADPAYAHAYNNLGLALAGKASPDNRNLDEAITNFTKAAELEPNYASAEDNLGHALLEKNATDDAIPHLEKAVTLNADSPEYRVNLGLALAQKGRLADAIPHFRRAIELDPKLTEAQYYLGESLVMSGLQREGLAAWRTVLSREPNNIQVLNETAQLLSTAKDATLRNGSEAVELAQRAVELTKSGAPAILGTLATAQAEAGHFNQAAETAQRAADLATQQGNTKLASDLTTRAASFRTNQPSRQ